MRFYVDVFEVTETCQNGNERTIKKEVYSKTSIIDSNGKIRNNGQKNRIERAKNLLAERHYYKIKYITSKTKEILLTDEI